MKLRNILSIKVSLILLFIFLSFFAVAQPTITSFTPLQAKPGDVLTITGTNFNTTTTNNIVFFGATKATVTAASTTSLTVTVPVGATYAPISYLNTTTKLVALSRLSFNPVYSPSKPKIDTTDFSPKVDFKTGMYPTATAIADLDGDGKSEIVVANSGSDSISIFQNTSTSGSITTSSFATKISIVTGSLPQSIVVGDLDGDGKPDLVVICLTEIYIHRNTGSVGNLNFTASSVNTSGPYSYFFVENASLGDIDGDGKLDLAVGGPDLFANYKLFVFRNNGNSTTPISFESAVLIYPSNMAHQPGVTSLAFSDLDGDGKPDLVVNYDNNVIGVFRNISTAGTVAASSFSATIYLDNTLGVSSNKLAICDWDSDGKPDIVFGDGGSLYVLRNTSAGVSSITFNYATFLATCSNSMINIGDLNGDGKPDAVTPSSNDNTFKAIRNTSTSGSPSSSISVGFTTGTNPYYVAIGDLDGDGKPDAITVNYDDSTISVFRNTDGTTWNGTTWSNGTPTATVDATIASSIAPASFSSRYLTINSGVALNTTGITASVNSDIANNGNGISGTGGLTIAANSSLNGNAISFNGTLTVNSGATLTTNNLLTLTSNATNTARVANSAGIISGNVTVQRYIPGGRRAFRFLSHPFTTNLSLSSLTDNIDITGTGGSPITATASNSPSAFRYDNTNGNSSLTIDPGWAGLTASSTLNAKAAYRVLVRGSKGQSGSLTGGTYTPDPVTLDWTGTLNQGNQIVTLTNNGTNKDYNLIGNPYASPVDVSLLTLGSNINANFSVWNVNAGTKGAYVTQPFATSYILPSGAAFFARTSANTNNTITFTESSKSSATPTSLLRNNSKDEILLLEVKDANGSYADQLQFMFNSANRNYTANNDMLWDGEKMTNPEVNFYSFSKDGKKLAIDRRPAEQEESIALGFVANAGNYTIEIKHLPKNNAYYLKDNYLGTQTLLVENSTINIVVTTDAASQGNARFELVTKQLPTIQTESTFTVTLSPNPVKDIATITYTGLEENEASSITITSNDGKQVQTVVLGKQMSGKQNINIQQLAKGAYFVTLINGANTKTLKFIKQ